ncbi:kinesin-like protein KIN-13A [Impatiens glandulifera]|uniref:kinesin-like protein KIN-13A n=1 Tax=Impatiens glandulifera TaxID=253017 RepID=UPI001FB04CD3|nr:kinesin-like protein KIN-13A [Impatiens glandulifera]
MGGHTQQNNAAAAATAMYDYPGAGPANDAGDAVMARWLQSAGLQHLASPVASNVIDQRLLPPNHYMQPEDKQRISKLTRNLNFNGEPAPEQYIPTAQTASMMFGSEGIYPPDFRGDFGAGLLDLHSVDDSELLYEHVMSEPFEESSSYMPAGKQAFEDEFNMTNRRQTNDKEINTRENNVAKIKVVVRKRPLNKKETAKKEEDIVTVIDGSYLTVHEPKLKVDLTAYVEKHEFCFDAVLNEYVTNDEVYRMTVEPIIPTIFQRTKATCFAYGQTGSGKTFTMQPLPLRAAEDIVRLLHHPTYCNQKLKLWLSFFEIYGGKLFDLLSERKKLCMREDGRQQVCIVGLQEFEVSDVQIVKEYIERGNAARSTGTTGANEESSRSHAILQLVIKKHIEPKDPRRNIEVNDFKNGKVVGKISFIDLAGSERGADTTDNDRQTRIEGAEINKSLLALKECIRALDNDQIHIPFRGSKLTEVLRDSFVGNSRTVMISCISPNAGSCEHTINTLRYADRVKSLSKSGNPKKEQAATSFLPTTSKDPADDIEEQYKEVKMVGMKKKVAEVDNQIQNPIDVISSAMERVRVDTQEKLMSPRRKAPSRVDEKLERQTNLAKDEGGGDLSNYKQQKMSNLHINNNGGGSSQQRESEIPDGNINEILEEEDALIAAHRKEIEDTMGIVREEMKLLGEVEKPGSQIDNYVSQLSFVLSRKAAGLVSLQARLARFQHRLKEKEILSRKKVSR